MGEDMVESYFGMRKAELREDENGIKRLFLNDKPYFHNGVLDQGYWPDGLYTAPSDEAMIADIQTMKDMGFNMLRKHIKIEPLRWYYHCDRLGMLVWQDMINGGGKYDPLTVTAPLFTGINIKDDRYARFARQSEEGRKQFRRELDDMLKSSASDPERLIEEASQALAASTGCAAVTTTPNRQISSVTFPFRISHSRNKKIHMTMGVPHSSLTHIA